MNWTGGLPATGALVPWGRKWMGRKALLIPRFGRSSGRGWAEGKMAKQARADAKIQVAELWTSKSGGFEGNGTWQKGRGFRQRRGTVLLGWLTLNVHAGAERTDAAPGVRDGLQGSRI
jgi:hypothetical protein